MKKPRIQSPLDLLPLHQKQALLGWLTTGGRYGQGVTYREAQTRLRSEFGVTVGTSALCGFFQRSQRAAAAPATGVRLQPDGKTLTITINLQSIQQ